MSDVKYQEFKDEEITDKGDDGNMEPLNINETELDTSIKLENRDETRKEIDKKLDEAEIGENIIEKEFNEYVDERDGKPLVNLQIQDDEEEGKYQKLFFYFFIKNCR